jgi:hypothetical protein
LRKSSDKGPIPRRLRFGAPQESDFQRLGKNTTRFNPAGNRSSALKSRRDTDTTSSYVTLDLCVEAVGDNAYAFLTPFFSGASLRD